LEGDARELLPGPTDDDDFAILTATFAKAIQDLGLHLVTIVEHQPRAGQPNRLEQIRDALNVSSADRWRSDETQITYDNPNNPFSGLQFGLLWNSDRVTVDPDDNQLLTDLRQPRNEDGSLTHRRLRAPWLIPVQTGDLSFDLMVLHLKSGGGFPQADEVEAIESFIRVRQSLPSPRHLIVCGDWNIRPDRSAQRGRLRRMMVPFGNEHLMTVLTVEVIPPSLEEWSDLSPIEFGSATAATIPFTHYNANSIDTLLDHFAISASLSEVFDHPIQVVLADDSTDLRPGIRIATPLVSEEEFHTLTDHLPVVLILRTNDVGDVDNDAEPALVIVAAMPNPPGNDVEFEQVHLRNNSTTTIVLTDWRIGDATGTHFWILDTDDGSAGPGEVVIVVRRSRNMFLNNKGGDTIVLIDPSNQTIDEKGYTNDALSGRLFRFD